MTPITNGIEQLFFGDVPGGNLNGIGNFFHNIIADATYAPTKHEGDDPVTLTTNENFHPYSAMMRATVVSFFVLLGIQVTNNRAPYYFQGIVKTVGTATAVIPLFHLYGIAMNSIRKERDGKTSTAENKSDIC